MWCTVWAKRRKSSRPPRPGMWRSLSRDDVPLEDFVSFLPGEKENCSRLGPMRPRKRNEQPPPHCRDLSTENVVGAGEGVSGESLSLSGPLGLRKGGK